MACVICFNILDLAAINAFYIKWLPGQMSHVEDFFCGFPKSFVRDLMTKERLAHINPVALTAACRKAVKESTVKAKTAPTKHVKHAAPSLSLFVVNALENKRNSFFVRFAANEYCSCTILSYFCS